MLLLRVQRDGSLRVAPWCHALLGMHNASNALFRNVLSHTYFAWPLHTDALLHWMHSVRLFSMLHSLLRCDVAQRSLLTLVNVSSMRHMHVALLAVCHTLTFLALFCRPTFCTSTYVLVLTASPIEGAIDARSFPTWTVTEAT